MIREVVLADQRFDMVSRMTLRGDEHGADLYRSLRGTMENWEKAISSGPGEEAPRARWEAVFNTVKTIAEKIVSSGRLPPVLE